MASATTFVSYTNAYDHYVGKVSLGDLPAEQQDDFIRVVFDNTKDFRQLAVSHNVLKAQVEGLWTVIVLVASALEGSGQIRDMSNRTAEDNDKIIAALAGTNLWLRLEEAFPPFVVLPSRTKYNWQELEGISMETLAGVAGGSMLEVKDALYKLLKSRPMPYKPDVDWRMPYHAFKKMYDEGKLMLFVDRGLAPVAGAAGIVKSAAPMYVAASVGAAVTALPLWYFLGFAYALVAVVVAVGLFKRSTAAIQSAVRIAAISNRDAYRWLLSRKVIWKRQP
jgi:hypothetical protein